MPTLRHALSCAILTIAVSAGARSQTTIPPDKDALLKGEGMGLAAPAERNGYPGPKHVLALKDTMKLSRDQVRKVEELAKGVSVAATVKGEQIVEEEDELENAFVSGKAQEKTLRARLESIARLRADLRFIHLQAHLRMKQVLSPEQIRLYTEIRRTNAGR